jgi:hypothetical protein
VANAPRWLVLLGSVLLLISPTLPQCRIPLDQIGLALALGELAPGVGSPLECAGLAVWLFTPFFSGAVILLGSLRASGPPAAIRGLTLALLLLVSFAQATVGSILLTLTGAGPQAPAVSFPIALALFVLPLLLGGVALARLVGGDFDRSSGGFARLSLGLLAAVQGLFLLDSGWDLLLSWMRQIGIPRALPGAWLAPAGGLMVAAGEILTRLRPRAAVDTVPASG